MTKKKLFKWSWKATKEEKEKSKVISKKIILLSILFIFIIISIFIISTLNYIISSHDVDIKLLYCRQNEARVALYRQNEVRFFYTPSEPMQVEVTVKGIGDTMEVKTQRVYLARGETRNLDFPFTINVNECEASKKII
jgi:hypothetical protein